MLFISFISILLLLDDVHPLISTETNMRCGEMFRVIVVTHVLPFKSPWHLNASQLVGKERERDDGTLRTLFGWTLTESVISPFTAMRWTLNNTQRAWTLSRMHNFSLEKFTKSKQNVLRLVIKSINAILKYDDFE